MSSPLTDRNLLFAVLALQADFLTSQQFVEICTVWASRKETPLADLLVERGWLTPSDKADVERLLERKIQKHQGDLQASLMELTSPQVREALGHVPDPVIQQTLGTPPLTSNVLISTSGFQSEERDRYTITRLHAVGGIGRVWLARDPSFGRDVALKELRPEQSGHSSALVRFIKEARITGQLEHPGVVPVYEIGIRSEDHTPFYTMRFVRGRTLRDAIEVYHQKRRENQQTTLEFRDLLSAFLGVCNAIGYAHSRGVIHRDLKPANVVLGDYGEVIVLDWGLAKLVSETEPSDSSEIPITDDPCRDDPTIQGQVMGTPAYMAPEQADGRVDLMDARTDVYGLGAILYEIETGKPPFLGSNTQEILEHVRHRIPTLPRTIVRETPPPLEAITLKCLQKKREDRYPTAKVLAGEIQHFLADEPVTAWNEPFGVRVRRWSRRHRVLVTSALVALIVAIPILLTGIVLLDQSANRERESRQNAEKSEQLERTAREQAQASYRRALKSADVMAEELARGIRPILGTERKTIVTIVDRANRIYEELLSDPEPSRAAMESQARTLVLFAELHRETNQIKQARKTTETALQIYDRLLKETPDEKSIHIDRARAIHRLAWILLDQGFDDESIRRFRESIQALESYGAVDDPQLSAVLLGSAYTFLGNQLKTLGDWDAAKTAYLRGLELRRKAATLQPNDSEIQTGLSISFEKWGRMLFDLGEKEQGLDFIRQACRLDEALTAMDPWNSELHLHLVRSLNTLAQSTADKQEITTSLSKAEQIIERFAKRDPSHLIWQRESLRYQFNQKQLELKATGLSTDQRKANIVSQIQVLEKMFNVLQERVQEEPENYLSLGDVANIRSRIAQANLDLLVFVGIDEKAMRTKASEQLEPALNSYSLLLKRSPNSIDWQQGRIFTLFQIARLSQQSNNPVLAIVDQWTHLSEQLKLYRQLTHRFPNVEEWQRQLARSLSATQLNFLPSQLADNAWETHRTDPKVIEALIVFSREVSLLSGTLPANLDTSIKATRKLVIKYLEEINGLDKLPPEGKDLLAKFKKE